MKGFLGLVEFPLMGRRLGRIRARVVRATWRDRSAKSVGAGGWFEKCVFISRRRDGADSKAQENPEHAQPLAPQPRRRDIFWAFLFRIRVGSDNQIQHPKNCNLVSTLISSHPVLAIDSNKVAEDQDA